MINNAGRTQWSMRSLMVALLPLWGVVILSLIGDYFSSVLRSPPEFFGLPLGLLLVSAATLLTAFGAIGIWSGRSRRRSVVACVLLTVPATILAIATPAVILLVINLSPASA